MTDSKEVATTKRSRPAAVEVAAGIIPRDKDVISQYLQQEREEKDVTALMTHQQIINDIMASPTVDDVLEVLDPEKWDPFVGRHIRIDTFTVQESEYEQGPPVYFSVKLVDLETETKHLVNTGEQAIMAQLLKLEQLNAFPLECTIHSSTKPNQYGRYLKRITKWEA